MRFDQNQRLENNVPPLYILFGRPVSLDQRPIDGPIEGIKYRQKDINHLLNQGSIVLRLLLEVLSTIRCV